MIYNVIDVAGYVLSKCTAEGFPISNLQLQKILYYIQKDFLQELEKPCFDEEIEAWQFGPVVPIIYRKYSGFGSLKIKEEAVESPFSEEDQKFVDAIVEDKRCKMPWELVEETHESGKAWDIVYKSGEGYKALIPKAYIKQYG